VCLRRRFEIFEEEMRELSALLLTHVEGISYDVFDIFCLGGSDQRHVQTDSQQIERLFSSSLDIGYQVKREGAAYTSP
jgi:hypothetical protein